MEKRIRRFEAALGIDRHGRTVWIWVLPPAIGLVTAVLFGYVAALPEFAGDMPLALKIASGIFGFVLMTILSAMTLAWFGDSENEE
jgi:hypothetical protein